MKTNFILFAILAVLTLYSCQGDSRESTTEDANTQANTKQETPEKMIEYLAGEWQLDNAGAAGNSADRLTFTEEARYIARSGNQKTDSGAFRMNEQLNNLYLESEANEQPREFEIEVNENVMTLKPRQPAAGQENVSYTYRRVGEPSISAEKRGEN
jgi:hypothetical protein